MGLRVVGYRQESRALQDALTKRRVILWTNLRSAFGEKAEMVSQKTSAI